MHCFLLNIIKLGQVCPLNCTWLLEKVDFQMSESENFLRSDNILKKYETDQGFSMCPQRHYDFANSIMISFTLTSHEYIGNLHLVTWCAIL